MNVENRSSTNKSANRVNVNNTTAIVIVDTSRVNYNA